MAEPGVRCGPRGRHRPAGMSASAAVQTTAERGTDLAALDMKITLLRPVHPDGQQLVATGTVPHRGRRLAVGRPRFATAAARGRNHRHAELTPMEPSRRLRQYQLASGEMLHILLPSGHLFYLGLYFQPCRSMSIHQDYPLYAKQSCMKAKWGTTYSRSTVVVGFHASRIRTIESPPSRGLARTSTGARRSPRHPEGRGVLKETHAIEGDSADARREGTVPDRRWRLEWLPRTAARRTEQLPEHQGAGLLLTRTRNTGCR
jgi:hypothetical protein